MIIVTKKGYYFVGKVKDLSRHLKLLKSRYSTLQELLTKNSQ